ncbi:hypothetical protein [Nonomuraea dietziae]|uniref:Uncharacterized protein n=1 Tax=Nonomuraea dietziae TaxID=65515 RepID=A0A7W5YCK2_9ACTN|nr:hypothetical protein [Nonomuraea dietziae]
MAMPTKGSRLISVDGTAFRWRIRHKPTYGEGNGWSPLTITIERTEEPGRVLVVSLPCARPDNWHGERTIAVRPALVPDASGEPSNRDGTPGNRARHSPSPSPRTNWPRSWANRLST